jgi:hypothetical protein
MSNPFVKHEANADFQKARSRETLHTILNLLNPSQQELLSLREVRETLKPKSESYRGLQVVDIDRIVGSEGRYADFNRNFLPRHEHLRNRWTRVDEAHIQMVNLPPIRLYEIGGVYFVRDGNHRVSVARAQGVKKIDAEVVSLDSEVRLDASLTREKLKQAVVAYEREQFYKQSRFDKIFPDYDLEFTATGRYDEVLQHIYGHKYYVNLNYQEEIPFEAAMRSWYSHVFLPIIHTIREQKILSRFPGRTEADLYVWLVKHWDELKRKYGTDFSLNDAADDLSRKFGKSLMEQIREYFRKRRERKIREKRIARGEIIDDE